MVRARSLALRHCDAIAVALLAVTVAGSVAALLFASDDSAGDLVNRTELVYAACQLLPYGVVGAILISRRPDLPFGWVLAIACLALVAVVGIAVPASYAFEDRTGSELALWGVAVGGLAWVPAALEGVVNVRFPSGVPTGRLGRLLDRALRWGIVVVAVAALLGDWMEDDDHIGTQTRFIDATPIPRVADALLIGIPVLILLGALAGIGVVVRSFRATGLERRQLQWRASGVVVALLLFPFVFAEVTPDWVTDVMPFVFAATLLIPVLRYDLWAIDSIVRRSAAYTMASPGSVLTNLVRAAGEMLRLPYVAVGRPDGLLAVFGEPTGSVDTWPLFHDGEYVGQLQAAPRHGRGSIDEQDASVLATVAELVSGLVRAEGLTHDLQDARLRLVTAREEERRRLRRDLHDGLGPLLTGLGLNLDAAMAHLGRDDQRSATYLDNAQHASSEVINSLREVVHGLRPPALDELGLAGALRLHLERVATDAGVELQLTVPAPSYLPAAVEVAAFRTAVEGLTNVARHGRAGTAVVVLVEADGALTVTVTDDGPQTGEWRHGVGLCGMRERAEELGGTMEAGPTPAGGRIRVVLPTLAPPS